MSADFFDRQDRARRRTVWLVVMFALAVAAIIAAIYLTLAAVFSQAAVFESDRTAAPPSGLISPSLWNPQLLLWVVLGTLTVIALASSYKTAELSAGGKAIALMLGGREVSSQTLDPAERRLLNVVEEMSLASGIPAPPVFVLENEPGINAFAAGYRPSDAVVAVSAGCLKYLTREELQGVVAHEFSHILNGDMRLNLRLIGVLYGILVLAIIGYYLMRIAGSSSRRSRRNDPAAAFFLLGLVLMLFGYIGVFFGKLIKAAINRQREYLADAAAVQYTRYPPGIAGALKKIGGLSYGSRISDAHAEEVSHMFFGDAFAGTFFNIFATHPPLVKRIQAIDPSFDGVFPKVVPVTVLEAEEKKKPMAHSGAIPIPAIPLPVPVLGEAVSVIALDATGVTERVGQPQRADLDKAVQTIEGLPALLVAAAHESFAAQALVFALLLSRNDAEIRRRQMELLSAHVPSPLARETQRLAEAAQTLPAADRLPLVDLAVPALKMSSPRQYTDFRRAVEVLVNADNKIDLFEYCLKTLLFHYLDVHFGLQTPPTVRYHSVAGAAQPAITVLSILAHAGQKDEEKARAAFLSAITGLVDRATMRPRSECTLKAFDAALAELARLSPKAKRAFIAAMAVCISWDGRVMVAEGELLRAVSAMLDCPMPPLPVLANSQTSYCSSPT